MHAVTLNMITEPIKHRSGPPGSRIVVWYIRVCDTCHAHRYTDVDPESVSEERP